MKGRPEGTAELYGVILAGGKGERFWPKSRRGCPKQLLSLVGEKTMLEETAARVLPLIPKERLLVVATEGFEGPVKEQAHDLGEHNLLFEPQGRNTAPAIGYAAEVVYHRAPASKMAVLPADHNISERDRFLKTLSVGSDIADQGYLVTFGIVPTRPETGYGYIEAGERIAEKDGVVVHRSLGFKEKPNQKEAMRFLKAGNYFWNSGMFVWKTKVILDAFEEHMSDLSKDLRKLRDCVGGPGEKKVLRQIYKGVPAISIDYGVMERASNVAVVRADFSWDDVGSWTALEKLRESDGNGNVVFGDHLGVETKNSVIVSENGLVATVGVSDLVVVNVEGVTLVCPKKRVQEVKTVVQQLSRDRGLRKYL